MHDAGIDQPGTMAAVLGLDDDQVEIACRRADADVWVANFNAPGQVVIAGSPDGVEPRPARTPRSSAPRRSCRCRCPARSTRRSWRRPATGCARRSPTPTRATPRCRSCRTSTPCPTTSGDEWASLLSAQLRSPVRWKHCLLTLDDARRHRLRRARPGRRAHRHGQAHASTGARTISVATPEDLDKLLEWVDAGADAERRRPHRGRAPVRRRAPRRQPGGRHLHADRRIGRRRADRRRHRARPRRRRTRSARRSPACCRATSPSTANGSPPANPSPGCARRDEHDGGRACPQSDRRPGAVITGWGTALPAEDRSPTHDLEQMIDTNDEWIVERTGIRERHVGGTTVGSVDRGRAGRRSSMAGRRPGARSTA